MECLYIWGLAVIPLRVREIRKAQKMSLETLAERAKISVSYLSRLERGEKDVTLENLASIAAALSVTPAELIDTSKAWQTLPLFGLVVDVGRVVVPVSGSGGARVPAALGDVVVLRVEGVGNYPRYMSGDVLACMREPTPVEQCLERECLVELSTGEIYVRTVQMFGAERKARLLIHNAAPIETTALATCRPIVYVGRA